MLYSLYKVGCSTTVISDTYIRQHIQNYVPTYPSLPRRKVWGLPAPPRMPGMKPAALRTAAIQWSALRNNEEEEQKKKTTKKKKNM